MLNVMQKFVAMIFLIVISNYNVLYAKPVVVYAHGLGENAEICKIILVDKIFPGLDLYGRTGPEAAVKRFDLEKIYFGQQGDIDQIIAACQEALQQHESPEIIAFGVSKGAATWLNTVSYLNKSSDPEHKKILACIKAVVLVAPFAELFESEIMTGLLGPLGQLARRFTLPDFFGLGKKIVGLGARLLLPSYDAYGVHPITSVTTIPSDLPIFIAHSLGDGLVPIKHSRMIYSALIKNQQRSKAKNTYLFEFDGEGHCESIYNPFNTCNSWHNPMYEFLKKYNFIHQKELVDDIDLGLFQPEAKQVEAKIFKKSTIPSLGYGLMLVAGIEAFKYIIYKNHNSVNHQTNFKKSLLYGLVFAAALETVHLIRKQV